MNKYIGFLPVIGTVSDKPPQGGRSHCVRLTEEAGAKLGRLLTGSPLLDEHGGPSIGTIQKAEVFGQTITLHCESEKPLHKNGLSYEINAVKVMDTRSKIWEIYDFEETTGVAVVENVAYRGAVIL